MNWLFLTPRRYYEGYSWLGRDIGLACMGMRELGVRASFAAYRAPGVPEADPFLPVDPDEVASRPWWESKRFTHLFVMSCARREFEPILRAAKSAGVFVAVRMDSDGWQSPRQGFRRYYSDLARSLADSSIPYPRLRAGLKTAAFRMVPAIADRVWLRQFELADATCIESPLAASRLRDFFEVWNRPDLARRIHVVPGPVPAGFHPRLELPRKNRIIAVGRFRYRQKNAELLASSLRAFLKKTPGWDAVVIGNGEEKLEKLFPDCGENVRIPGRIDRDLLPAEYASAKIALSTSYADGFPNFLAEAVCSGCSVVGPSHISSSHYFCGKSSGTLYDTLTLRDSVRALDAEASAWDDGRRDPVSIGASFQNELQPGRVAEKLLELSSSRINAAHLP